jgi:streptomycin 6-kinase
MLDIYQILYKTCFISYPPSRISTTIAHFAQLSRAREAKLIGFSLQRGLSVCWIRGDDSNSGLE